MAKFEAEKECDKCPTSAKTKVTAESSDSQADADAKASKALAEHVSANHPKKPPTQTDARRTFRHTGRGKK